jgi:RNA polymerase sigma-70 factor, ECF subfamily
VLWEELSHSEAGRVLDCSANAVAIRVHRAKGRLREVLLAEEINDLPNAQLHRPIDPTRS